MVFSSVIFKSLQNVGQIRTRKQSDVLFKNQTNLNKRYKWSPVIFSLWPVVNFFRSRSSPDDGVIFSENNQTICAVNKSRRHPSISPYLYDIVVQIMISVQRERMNVVIIFIFIGVFPEPPVQHANSACLNETSTRSPPRTMFGMMCMFGLKFCRCSWCKYPEDETKKTMACVWRGNVCAIGFSSRDVWRVSRRWSAARLEFLIFFLRPPRD